MPLSDDQKTAALEAAAWDLKFLLSDTGLDRDLQASIFYGGGPGAEFNALCLFKDMAVDTADLRSVLKDHFGLDPAAGLQPRAQVTKVVTAWTRAKEQVQKDDEMRAEAKAARMPRPVGNADFAAMKTAYEKLHPKMTLPETLAKSYLGGRLDQVEDNEPQAEFLADVLSKEDGQEDFVGASLHPSGQLRFHRGSKK